jgi:hypothetical protein
MLERLAVVAIGGGGEIDFLFLIISLYHLLGVRHAERIEIADRDDAGGVLLEDAGHVHIAADAAAADLEDVDFVARSIRPEDLGGDDGGEADGGSGEYRGLEEAAAGLDRVRCHGMVFC